MKDNILWEKHRMYLPQAKEIARHKCKDCRYFVRIQGKRETKFGCIVNIKAYSENGRHIPDTIPIMEVIKRVGLEGLDECIKNGVPENSTCSFFKYRC